MMKEIYIIAGGTSLKGFDFSKLKNKDVIVVNKAILDAPFAKYFITMDYTFIDKKLKEKKFVFEQSKANKIFIVNLCPEYMIEERGTIIDTRTNYVYDLNQFDMIIKSRFSKGVGFDFNKFSHGSNSGFCGLQLAICLGYKKIHLLGYDLQSSQSQTHYHQGYGQNITKFNEKLEQYLSNFKCALKILKFRHPDIEIYNYSPKSLLSMTTMKSLEEIC